MQRELQTLENKRIDLGVLDAMMRKFDGSDSHDVNMWLNDLEIELFRYSERDKLVATRHLLTGHAKRFTEILSVRSYDDLKRALIIEFKRAFTVQDVLRQLRARVIKPEETPRQYVIEMQHIASRSEIAETDLIEIIIDGKNDDTNLISMLYSATTMGELKM